MCSLMPAKMAAPNLSARKRRPACDQIRGPFRNHNDRRVYVSADEVGHHRSIDNPEPGDSSHTQRGIDDRMRIGVGPHLAGSERMMDRDCRCMDVLVDLTVGKSGWSELAVDVVPQRLLAADVSRHSKSGSKQLAVVFGC
jgi:hypothetical protein